MIACSDRHVGMYSEQLVLVLLSILRCWSHECTLHEAVGACVVVRRAVFVCPPQRTVSRVQSSWRVAPIAIYAVRQVCLKPFDIGPL